MWPVIVAFPGHTYLFLAILLQCLYLSADGKTVTVRKTESVSKTAGVGGMSYGKPAGR